MLHVESNFFIVAENLLKILIYVTHNEEDAQGIIIARSFRNNNIKQLDCENIIVHGGKLS